MGFFDLFKKNSKDSSELLIDVSDRVATINGKALAMPSKLSELTDILGKPRYFRGGAINYIWDDLGIYCYATEQQKVYCLAIKVEQSNMPIAIDPKLNFRGVLTLRGRHWEEVLSEGEDLEIARSRDFDGVSLFGEYVNFDSGDKNGSSHAYVGMEMNFAG